MSAYKQVSIKYQVLEDPSALPDSEQTLLEKAKEAASKAYAPYSGFHVGAALELASGEVVLGNNQENASFPAGICAERNAIFHAAAQDPNMVVKAMAIIAFSEAGTADEPVPPCGICRQVVAEYEAEQGAPIRVILAAASGRIHIFDSMRDLLPFHFHEKGLKRHT